MYVCMLVIIYLFRSSETIYCLWGIQMHVHVLHTILSFYTDKNRYLNFGFKPLYSFCFYSIALIKIIYIYIWIYISIIYTLRTFDSHFTIFTMIMYLYVFAGASIRCQILRGSIACNRWFPIKLDKYITDHCYKHFVYICTYQ